MNRQKVGINSDQNSKRKASNNLANWIQFKGGDDKAFAYLYKEYFHSLYNYGTKFTVDKELVKDSIHDLFINLRKYRSTLTSFTPDESNDADPVKFYLYRSFRRILAGKLSESHPALLTGDIPDNYHFQVTISFEENLIISESRNWRINQLNKSLKKLPSRQKEAVYLRFYEGYSFQQIAELMGSNNIKSTRSLIYKALDNLRKHLEIHISALVFCLL